MTAIELRYALIIIGWSGRHLAERLGVCRSYPAKWMAGRGTMPEPVAAWLCALVKAHLELPHPVFAPS